MAGWDYNRWFCFPLLGRSADSWLAASWDWLTTAFLRRTVTIFRLHLLRNQPWCRGNEGNEILHYTEIEVFKPLGDALKNALARASAASLQFCSPLKQEDLWIDIFWK